MTTYVDTFWLAEIALHVSPIWTEYIRSQLCARTVKKGNQVIICLIHAEMIQLTIVCNGGREESNESGAGEHDRYERK